MQTDIFMGMEVFTGVILPFILGMAATVARTARYGWQGLTHFLTDAIVCVFVSVIVFWGLDMFPDILPTVKAAITGLSSFMCNELLDWVRQRTRFEVLNRWRAKAKGREE